MGSSKNVAVVAPVQLGNAFMVLLQSASGIRPLASATNVAALLPVLAGEIPDVVLLYIDEDAAGGKKGQVTREQIGQSKAAWSDVICIVIVKDSQLREKVIALGADVIFNVGVTPARLLKTIESFDNNEKDNGLTDVQEDEALYAGLTLEDKLKQLGGRDPWWRVWGKKKYAR